MPTIHYTLKSASKSKVTHALRRIAFGARAEGPAACQLLVERACADDKYLRYFGLCVFLPSFTDASCLSFGTSCVHAAVRSFFCSTPYSLNVSLCHDDRL